MPVCGMLVQRDFFGLCAGRVGTTPVGSEKNIAHRQQVVKRKKVPHPVTLAGYFLAYDVRRSAGQK